VYLVGGGQAFTVNM